MERLVGQQERELVGAGLELVPVEWRHLMSSNRWVHFFTRTDPRFAGLHAGVYNEFQKGVGYRPWSETTHCCYRNTTTDGSTTIVIPRPRRYLDRWHPYHIVHELGHAFHQELGFKDWQLGAYSEYAKVDIHERFAEAFAVYCLYGWLDDRDDMALFDYLKSNFGACV
jgi:hypothetical protein